MGPELSFWLISSISYIKTSSELKNILDAISKLFLCNFCVSKSVLRTMDVYKDVNT